MVTQAVIVCGGLGSRLGSLVKDMPKPMLPVGGKPILEHTLEHLKANGITSVILAAGYKAEVLERFFRNRDWGIEVTVSIEHEPLGTAGHLHLIKDRLDDAFLLLYGDEFIDIDMQGFIATFERTQPLACILARPSTHPWDSHLLQTDRTGRITEFVVQHEPGRHYQNLGNAAVYILSKDILTYVPQGKSDFAQAVFPAALNAGERLQAHMMKSSDFVKDMGTPDRFAQVEEYLRHREEIEHARKNKGSVTAVFLDRDGVLNRHDDLIDHIGKVEILPGVPEAIRLFNEHGIRTIIVTNQPVLARGLCDTAALERINKHICDEISAGGGRIDAVYYCPHHPETHHGAGVRELRIACDCRKPKAGMLLQAKNDLGLKLMECVMIGDSDTDIEAGRNAGVRTILIRGNGVQSDPRPDRTCSSLLEAAKTIVRGEL